MSSLLKTRQALLKISSAAEKCQKRLASGGYKKVIDFKPPTMNDMPVPEGSWTHLNAARQKRHNMALYGGIAFCGFTLFVAQQTGSFYMGYKPDFKKLQHIKPTVITPAAAEEEAEPEAPVEVVEPVAVAEEVQEAAPVAETTAAPETATEAAPAEATPAEASPVEATPAEAAAEASVEAVPEPAATEPEGSVAPPVEGIIGLSALILGLFLFSCFH